eukprot:4248455-Amphidinium_carterae.1
MRASFHPTGSTGDTLGRDKIAVVPKFFGMLGSARHPVTSKKVYYTATISCPSRREPVALTWPSYRIGCKYGRSRTPGLAASPMHRWSPTKPQKETDIIPTVSKMMQTCIQTCRSSEHPWQHDKRNIAGSRRIIGSLHGHIVATHLLPGLCRAQFGRDTLPGLSASMK